MFVLFTDTDSDMTPAVAKEYGYHLISMPYVIDGKEVFPYEDFDTFNAHEFYESLRGGVMPSTCAISPQRYIDYFEPFFKEGKDILYVHLSRAMSGTFNAMDIAVKELNEKYPERTLYTIDAKGITLCEYAIARAVGDLVKEGKSLEEILEWSKTEVDKFTAYFFVEDLSFFRRSGRVKAMAAIMGNLIGIRPIIYMSSDGMMTSISKAKGRKATLAKIMEYVDTLQEDITSYRVIIAHADYLDAAKELGALVEAKYGCEIEYVDVNPTAGSHCGPNGVGIAFHAKCRG